MIQHVPGRVWLITGAGRGFGRLFATEALAAGDKVVATARKPQLLADLVEGHPDRFTVLPLDVSDRAAVFSTIERAIAAFGRLDIVVNNAGYGLSGAIEEVTEAQARELIDTNFFGALWVCQAVTPHLRAQRSGHIVQLSSVSGLIGIPTMGLYAASKFALEGMSEALAQELEPFGVNVTLVEPRAYATEFIGPSMQLAEWKQEYLPVRAALMEQYGNRAPGDPARVAEAMLELVSSPRPPRRLLLGDGDYDTIFQIYRQRMAEWKEWEHISRKAG
jgi:NAD(P)-dependent dehydrogenase (short-subunit alcohol dehydrogenase family)